MPQVAVELFTDGVADVDFWLIEEAEVFTEELEAKREPELARFVFHPVHHGLDELFILHDEGDFRVPFSQHAAIIDVCRAANDEVIVYDEELGVDVDQLRDQIAV